jgi:hypothetical protein
VTFIDEKKRHITMVDPYEDFTIKDRVVSINRFVRLWWDTNNFYHQKTKKLKIIKDTRMLFVITPKEVIFPEKLKMKKGETL